MKLFTLKGAATLAGALTAYVLLGHVLHVYVMPEPAPGRSDFPATGDVIENRAAGEKILFLKAGVDTEGAYSEREFHLAPHGAVPKTHIHTEYAETFTVTSGELTVFVAGEMHELRPGETLTVPRGVPHQPMNLGGVEAVSINRVTPAARHDLMLAQVHGFLTEREAPPGKGEFFLQAMLYSTYYDTYLAAPPVWAQKTMAFLLAPTIRALGYRSWRPEYSRKWKAAPGAK